MSSKFPPRVSLGDVEIFLFAVGGDRRAGEGERIYLSEEEHEAIEAGLKQDIAAAVELLSKMEKTKCEYNNRETVQCTCLLDGISMALAKLKGES